MNGMRIWLRGLAWWILGNVKPSENDIDAAIRAAFAHCGLNHDAYAPEFDVRQTGKFHEILIHAGDALGNPLRTVADLKALLR